MPTARRAALTSVGAKIKKSRTQKRMTLDQVANDTGCSTGYLASIESGKQMPPVGILLQIARALQIDSGDLLKEPQDNLSARVQACTQRTRNYAYSTLSPGAENKHLKAFRVKIKAKKDHKGVGYHHEGEEFIYVLKGWVEIAVGDHLNQLSDGESLHFNSGIQHNIRNIGNTEAELLVVIYHP
ncbi:MAG: XRE family transcriptional regulator [Acidobacteriota bacterium]